MSHLDAIIEGPGPKKLLSIDGGGIRGFIAIEFLAQLERDLRRHFNNNSLVLADYFDYVAGTSTGAIISTLVALGKPVDAIRDLYLEGAKDMFAPANLFQRLARRSRMPFSIIFGLIGILFMKPEMFTPNKLTEAIMKNIGDATLGDPALRTLLMIVMRNVTTDSPWWISNNPYAAYNVPYTLPNGATSTNLTLQLWRLIRASTAAPLFFPPEQINVDEENQHFIFQDGGMTVHNNPAFQLFLMATLPEYRLQWRTGADDLLLVSVGTGLCGGEERDLKVKQMRLLFNMQEVPAGIMRAATNEQDLLCRVFGRTRCHLAQCECAAQRQRNIESDPRDCRAGKKVGNGLPVGCNFPIWDSEIGNLIGNACPIDKKFFTYVRYNVELTDDGLKQLGFTEPPAKSIQPLDGTQNAQVLQQIGAAAAQHRVTLEDFEGFLDPSGLH